MTQMVFAILLVTDLEHSKSFYKAVGFTNCPQFSDDPVATMEHSNTIAVMLLTHQRWHQYTDRKISDAKTTAQLLLRISRDSREAINAIVEACRSGWRNGRSDADP